MQEDKGLANCKFLSLKSLLHEACVFGRKCIRGLAGFSNPTLFAALDTRER
jgi:hypothetical protein